MADGDEVLDTSRTVGRSAQIRRQKDFRRYELAPHSPLDCVDVGRVLWFVALWPTISFFSEPPSEINRLGLNLLQIPTFFYINFSEKFRENEMMFYSSNLKEIFKVLSSS